MELLALLELNFSTVALLLLIAFVSKSLYNLYLHPLSGYPGPFLARASRLYYAYYLQSGHYSDQVMKLHAQYGNCFRIAPDELSYSNADAWQDICGQTLKKGGEFQKDRTFYPISPNGVDSIITAPTDVHRRFKRLLSHPLSERALAAQESIIMSYIDLFIERIREQVESGKKVDMVTWFTFVSFDVLGDLAFGEPFGCLESGTLHSWIGMIHTAVKSAITLQTMQRFIPGLFGIAMRLMGATMDVDNFMFCALKARERLSKDLDRPDFITYIQRENNENGMNKEEIESNSQVLIDAGTETVASALSGIFFFLISTPRAHKKLISEIRSRFSDPVEITILSTQSLPYLKAVLTEGMRMYPPAPGTFPRTVPAPGAMICGKFVPGGYSVGVNQCAIMRSPENWEAPNEFAPERWTGDARFDEDKRMAYQPFGFGARSCIGKSLAYAEMRLIIAKLLWYFDVELMEDSKDWDKGQRTSMYWEKGDLNVKFTPVAK